MNPLRRRILQIGLTAPAIGSSAWRTASAGDTGQCESRAILDEGLHWTTPDGAEAVCRRIADAGFNVLIPCVWYGQGTTWKSALAPWDRRVRAHVIRDPGYDPMRKLLSEAGRRGLEVHPWFTVARRADGVLPEYAEPVTGRNFDFYNPGFRGFMARLVDEFVSRYAVDGVNLDYVRFGGPRPGYEREREELVSEVIEQVADRVRRRRPGAIISVDAAPWEPTMRSYGQDCVRWADEGLIDVAYSMQYQPSPSFAIVERLRATMRRPECLTMILGNFDRAGPDGTEVRPRRADHLARLIEQARVTAPGNGVAVYYYGRLSDDQVVELRASAFRREAKACWSRA